MTSSSSQHQQTSGDDPLLCPLQQHGTNCHQTSGICSRWDLSNTDSRLICLTVIDMSKHHCISRHIDNSRPCNGWWGSMLRRVRNCRFIIILLMKLSLSHIHHHHHNNHFTLFDPVLSQRRDLLEQPLDFYEPDVLPATQPVILKHYRKTEWFGRLLFYRHGISTPRLTNSVKATKER